MMGYAFRVRNNTMGETGIEGIEEAVSNFNIIFPSKSTTEEKKEYCKSWYVSTFGDKTKKMFVFVSTDGGRLFWNDNLDRMQTFEQCFAEMKGAAAFFLYLKP